MDLNENLIRETEQGLIKEQSNEKKKGEKKRIRGKVIKSGYRQRRTNIKKENS